MTLTSFLTNLPEVTGPTQKRLSFKVKLIWTLIILVLFFILGNIPLFGLGPQSLSQFEFLKIIFAANFGSLVSLGIGPIVTASIVLQLLNGTGMLKFDLTKPEERAKFQGLQKLMSIFFVVLEACIYVFMGGLSPEGAFSGLVTKGSLLFVQLQVMLIIQLTIGGLIVLFMDEVVSKWGFGSGISLFIAAGVSQEIFVRLLTPFTTGGVIGLPFGGTENAAGKLWEIYTGLVGGDTTMFLLAISSILATVIVFAVSIYAQSMKVEIPLSFGRIRGHGIRWPLNFIYTSNIPVILIAALLANVQLFATLFGAEANSLQWLQGINVLDAIIKGSMSWSILGHVLIYLLVMIVGAVIFSIFWVQSAGLDAKSQAKQMMNSGLQIPGFRRDERVLERLLNRYIWPLTVMGAIAVGLLAATADLLGALSRGTGILLSVMIIYKLYEDIAKQHLMDMNPVMRKFMGG
jgi:preprotein translocase subunit SecY